MASADVVNLIVSTVADFLTYMMPIIAVLAGISFILSFFFTVLMGMGKRTFKG